MTLPLANIPQIALALVVLALIGAPTGWLFLRLMRLRAGWSALPFAIITGHLILALIYDSVARMAGGALGLSSRVAIWLLLPLALAWLNRRSKRAQADTGPLVHQRWQAMVLALVAASAALIALMPLLNQDTSLPAGRGVITLYDWPKHVAMGTAALAGDHLPPANPFLSIDPALRYYYFGFVAPGMVPRLTGGIVSVANSLIALATLAAFAFPLLIYHLARAARIAPGGALVAATGVTLVGGLDILYNFGLYQQWGYWPLHVDGWMPFAIRRISAPSTQFIWTFQHVLGFEMVMLIAWLIVIVVPQERLEASRAFGTAVLLAALFGTSAILWLAVIISLAVFTVVEALRAAARCREATYRDALLPAAILSCSILLSLPTMGTLIGGNPHTTPIVSLQPGLPGARYGSLFGEWLGPQPLTTLLDFPLQMIPEFGVLLITGLLGLWMARRAWSRSRAVRLGAVMLAVAFCMVLMVREALPQTNSYAPRIGGIAWIALGLFTGHWWSYRGRSRWWQARPLRGALALMTALGVLSACYEPWIIVTHPQTIPAHEAALYDWLNAHLERDDVYLIDRQTSDKALLFVERRTALSSEDFANLFSAGPSFTQYAQQVIGAAFDTFNPRQASAYLRALALDYLVITSGHEPMSFGSMVWDDYFDLAAELAGYRIYRVLGE